MRFAGIMIRNLRGRPSRTLFTTFAIAVSVATVISMQSIAERFKQATELTLTKRNIDLVVLAAGVPDQLNSDLDATLQHKIARIPGVQKVAPAMVELTEIKRRQGNISCLVQGWPIESGPLSELQLLKGDWLSPGSGRLVLLGKILAENLKKVPGDIVEIQGELFTVQGIYQSFVVFENGALIMPIQELQRLSGRIGRVTGFSVVCTPSDNRSNVVHSVRDSIEKIAIRTDRQGGMTALPTREYIDNALPLRMSHALAWVVSLISVLVGSFGMLNTMIMSVLERVREIGLLRAIGWPKRRVMFLILGESLLLSLIGAVLGIVLAYIANASICMIPQLNGFIDGRLTLGAISIGGLLTICMGILGGLYPSCRAANLDPAEALRHE